MSKTKVINLFGAPCTGKSTCRAGLFYKLKLAGVNIEEANEWIKYKLYEGNEYVMKDQLYVFSKQRKQLKQLNGKVDVIVSDAPLLLSAIYGDGDLLQNKLFLEEFNKCDNINFLLHRNHEYSKVGRYQDEEEADEVQLNIEEFLLFNNIPYYNIKGDDKVEEILNILKTTTFIMDGEM